MSKLAGTVASATPGIQLRARKDSPSLDETPDSKHRTMMEKIESLQKLESIEETTAHYRNVLIKYVVAQAANELAGGHLMAAWLPQAPTLQAQMELSAHMRDEIRHGKEIAELLGPFGVDTQKLVCEDVSLTRHRFLTATPPRTWVELRVLLFLMESAAEQLLRDTADSSCGRLSRTMRRIGRDEMRHAAHGDRWIGLVWADVHHRAQVQSAVDLSGSPASTASSAAPVPCTTAIA